MGWRARRQRGRRRPATSADPVAVAVGEATATGPLVGPHAGEVTFEELPSWVEGEDFDEIDGFDTVVRFDDEINCYCDPSEGLEQALADQPGIEDVLAEDREVVYVRASLALADVKAAVIRAVVEVNRNPANAAPTDALSPETVAELTSAVRPQLAEAGFVNTPYGPQHFYREGGDGFAQSIAIVEGSGVGRDGTPRDGLVWIMSGTHVPGFGRDVVPRPELVAPVHCGQPAYHWVAPTADELGRVLAAEVLPALDATRDRARFGAWMAADPARVEIPMHRPVYARLLAEWGLIDEAARVVAHLDKHWRSMRRHADVTAARELHPRSPEAVAVAAAGRHTDSGSGCTVRMTSWGSKQLQSNRWGT